MQSRMHLQVLTSEPTAPNGPVSLLVRGELGRGAQGIVYEVADQDGKLHAFKCCTTNSDQAIQATKQSICTLISAGKPHDAFLWPTTWISCQSPSNKSELHGYLMPLIPCTHKPSQDLLTGQLDISLSDSIRTCIEISEAFDRLHLNGLCYRDISLGNIFIGPGGQCLLCDIDNITYDGNSGLGIIGTPGFMAPETVVAGTQPSVYTDLYSMAVLMFYIIYRGHPLEGKKESSIRILDEQAKRLLYGEEAVYIFDASNTSNRPTEEFHPQVLCMHGIMPEIVNETFHNAFTVGLKNPGRRLVSADWCSSFRQALNQSSYCSSCNAEVFRHKCWNCEYDPTSTTQELWPEIRETLRQSLSRITFDLWIDSLTLVDSGRHFLTLRTEDEFQFHEVKRVYYELIRRHAANIAGYSVAIELKSPRNQTYESYRSH